MAFSEKQTAKADSRKISWKFKINLVGLQGGFNFDFRYSVLKRNSAIIGKKAMSDVIATGRT